MQSATSARKEARWLSRSWSWPTEARKHRRQARHVHQGTTTSHKLLTTHTCNNAKHDEDSQATCNRVCLVFMPHAHGADSMVVVCNCHGAIARAEYGSAPERALSPSTTGRSEEGAQAGALGVQIMEEAYSVRYFESSRSPHEQAHEQLIPRQSRWRVGGVYRREGKLVLADLHATRYLAQPGALKGDAQNDHAGCLTT